LVRYFSELVENRLVAAQDGVKTLAVERKQSGIGAGVYRRWLRLVQHTGSLTEKVAGGEFRDGNDRRGPLDHKPAAALLDEEDRIPRFALAENHIIGADTDAAEASGKCPLRAWIQCEEDGRPVENSDPPDHVAICRPLIFDAPLPAWLTELVVAVGDGVIGPGHDSRQSDDVHFQI
jgi:hypothetical protein